MASEVLKDSFIRSCHSIPAGLYNISVVHELPHLGLGFTGPFAKLPEEKRMGTV